MGTNKRKKCAARKIIIVMGFLEQPRQDKNLLYQLDQLNKLTKEGPQSNEFTRGATELVQHFCL
jgi:hypothetical protein